MTDKYTFGDGDRAAARLRRLAELYEPSTRELLLRAERQGCALAADLGCGPGWSTRLLDEVVRPARTVGLDASERYVAEAKRLQPPALEFRLHDVAQAPLPIRPELLLCRFLLTHLRDTGSVLGAWGAAAAPGARLLIHETDALEADHPALARYYALVAELQRHYGQRFDVGARLDGALEGSPWRVLDSRAVPLAMPAPHMAELHLANLRTWRQDEYAARTFDAGELEELEGTLARIVTGEEPAASVRSVVRQVVAERRA